MSVIAQLFEKINDFKIARGIVYKSRVKSSYDNDRVVFYSNNVQHKSALNAEASGLILDKSTLQVLAFPPANLLKKRINQISDKFNRGEYKIQKMYDGTMINLYYFNNKWVFSTNKAYDVGSISWCGLNYVQAFNESLQIHVSDTTKFYNDLDTNYSYSFIMIHPTYHPMQTAPNLIFVQKICTKEGDNYLNVDHTPPENIPLPEEVKVDDIKQLYTNAKSKSCIGYVLRDINNKRGFIDNVMIEGQLMIYLRKMLYDRAFKDMADELSYDRVKLAILWAFLQRKSTAEFVNHFPQFEPIMDQLYNKLKQLVQLIMTDNDHPVAQSFNFKISLLFDKKKTKNASTLVSDYLRHEVNTSELYQFMFNE